MRSKCWAGQVPVLRALTPYLWSVPQWGPRIAAEDCHLLPTRPHAALAPPPETLEGVVQTHCLLWTGASGAGLFSRLRTLVLSLVCSSVVIDFSIRM